MKCAHHQVSIASFHRMRASLHGVRRTNDRQLDAQMQTGGTYYVAVASRACSSSSFYQCVALVSETPPAGAMEMPQHNCRIPAFGNCIRHDGTAGAMPSGPSTASK
jgi:hypothetical protein